MRIVYSHGSTGCCSYSVHLYSTELLKKSSAVKHQSTKDAEEITAMVSRLGHHKAQQHVDATVKAMLSGLDRVEMAKLRFDFTHGGKGRREEVIANYGRAFLNYVFRESMSRYSFNLFLR